MTNPAPVRPQLKTNRSLIKAILLSLITFGIYPLVMYTKMTNELNLIATPHDGKKSMHFLLLTFIIAPITCGIAAIVWQHRICNRMGAELQRRGIAYKFSAGTFWGWGVLGSLIVIGPLVFMHKYIKSQNLINADYNARG
jgi:hypothetical protein